MLGGVEESMVVAVGVEASEVSDVVIQCLRLKKWSSWLKVRV